MQHLNLITRRGFLDHSLKVGLGVALSTLTDIPLVMKRALAEGSIGLNGKKVLFIFLRGANDALNSVIPIGDSAYNVTNRPNILIPADPGADYLAAGPCVFPTASLPGDATFGYPNAIPLGNGFAALHPSLKFLAPVYNAGDLAVIHRVAYPKQSRSHFDSQNYWENGSPNNNLVKDGIFYRTMVESGLASTRALTGVSVQSSLPLSLRGSKAAMTNLNDPTRYNLFGIPNNTSGNLKADNALHLGNAAQFPDKNYRELLSLQYQNLSDTLSIFASLDFSETGNMFNDTVNTDNDIAPWNLFPTTNAKNGGGARYGAVRYAVDTGAYGFFNNLKSAAIILNKTDATIAGTEMGGFDTHNVQGGVTGSHANLQRRIGWAIYALSKYFTKYADKATWDNTIVVTMSEFGRTTVQNNSGGTDHAEAGVMFVAGGGIRGGYQAGVRSGVYGCSPNDAVKWIVGPAGQAGGVNGSMFGAGGRYLKRAVDFRSVLGEVVRNHLGATQNQVNRIIPGYADAREKLQSGGTSTIDNTPIIGELGIV